MTTDRRTDNAVSNAVSTAVLAISAGLGCNLDEARDALIVALLGELPQD